jgi:hypothetical protein
VNTIESRGNKTKVESKIILNQENLHLCLHVFSTKTQQESNKIKARRIWKERDVDTRNPERKRLKHRTRKKNVEKTGCGKQTERTRKTR